ncbi:MAG: rod shape-determining protein [Clostridiales bacterium]|nr:rod shape-determining protein [Clostridiales bacterium]
MARYSDIGIDLGTATVIIEDSNGVLLNEPAVVAVDREARTVLAVGNEARRMVGRTPGNIVTIRPLRDGTITDFDLVGIMLRNFVQKVCGKHLFGGPRVILAMPAGVNEMESHGISTGLFESGVRSTQTVEKPVAAAIGAGVPIDAANGQMVVDIGAGLTHMVITSMGTVINRHPFNTAGDQMDEAIIRYIRRKHNTLIGEITAEDIKKNLGSAMPRDEELFMEVTGRNLITGLPKVLRISSDEVEEAIDETVMTLIEAIHGMLETTPAELAADIFENGIYLTGGGAKLYGLTERISRSLKVDCRLGENPSECVARGCAVIAENRRAYGKYINSRRKR